MSVKLKERKVQLPAFEMRAAFTPGSFNAEKRTIDIVWSVGKKGLRGGYDPYFEELSMDPAHVRMGRLQSGNSPFTDNHEARYKGNVAVLGRILAAKIENGGGTATVRLEDPERLENVDAKDTIRKIESGTLVNCSVEYFVYAYERQPMVEGEEIPTYLAVDWEPTAVSIVPVGFDESAVVRGNEQKTVPCVFKNKLPNDRNEEVRMDEKEKMELERKAAEDKAAAEKTASENARTAEKSRQTEIRTICTKLGLEESFAKRMIDEDKTLDEVRKLVIDEKAKQSSETGIRTANPTVSVGADSAEKFREGAAQWLLQRAGSNVSLAVEKSTGKKLEGGEFRGMSMPEIARESLVRAGVNVRGMDKMKMIGLALTHRTGMQSTSDFGVLLENAMHKTLLASYGITPDTWSRFCKKGSVSDFRAHPRYRRGTFSRLDKVGQNGEVKNKQIPDGSKESITAETYGNIIAITRQSILNDDMGVFSDLAMQLGRAAKLSIEVDVYALLALNAGLGPVMSDGQTLFHATHNNIGAGTALGVAGIDVDRVVLASQKDPSGNEVLDLRPKVLVLPVGLGGDARVINEAQYDVDTANKLQKPNKVRGLFQDIVDTARLTGTRRYLFADPSIAPAIEVAFLDGQENPFLESEQGFRIEGVEWKVRHDYGTAGIDYRGAVTNAGV